MKMAILLFCLFGAMGFATMGIAADPRQRFGPDSPQWLEAVGTIRNEYVWQENPDELQQCTASLVAGKASTNSMIIVSAGHCVQGWVRKKRDAEGRPLEPIQYEYERVQSPMRVRFTRRDGTPVVAEVAEVLLERYGQSDGADYAVMRLTAPVLSNEIQPLVISDLPFAASVHSDYGLLEYELRNLPSRSQIRRAYWEVAKLTAVAYRKRFGHPKPFGTMAGYSADNDPNLGDGGKNLTYDDNCDFIDGHRGLQTVVWCTAYPGASGGPFVLTLERGKGLEHLLVGILSGGQGVIHGQLRMIPVDTPALHTALTEAFEKYH